jgi:hypothetical protein
MVVDEMSKDKFLPIIDYVINYNQQMPQSIKWRIQGELRKLKPPPPRKS